MPNPLVFLDAMPSAADFYAQYWNQKPFVVRGAIPKDDIENLIAADELAGLAMDETARSRMVLTAGEQRGWSCDFGPFNEEYYDKTGDHDWCLLVQNVEQHHPDTASLLHHFNFAPRWLMDDIMVSYSAIGGSVGPHIDSYHVFLVQGQGTRSWKVGREPVAEEIYIEGIDLKILDSAIEGDEVEMNCGDVLYLPPKFGHEGTTLEPALTFSVGFLGPKLSELYGGYGQYLSECEALDDRYVGAGLDVDSAGFAISTAAAISVRDCLHKPLDTKDFTQWMVEFFTESSHEDFGQYGEREDVLSGDDFEARLKAGSELFKPEYVKFAVTTTEGGKFCLGFDSQSFTLDERLMPTILVLMKEEKISIASNPNLFDQPATVEFLCELYNHQALEFLGDA